MNIKEKKVIEAIAGTSHRMKNRRRAFILEPQQKVEKRFFDKPRVFTRVRENTSDGGIGAREDLKTAMAVLANGPAANIEHPTSNAEIKKQQPNGRSTAASSR